MKFRNLPLVLLVIILGAACQKGPQAIQPVLERESKNQNQSNSLQAYGDDIKYSLLITFDISSKLNRDNFANHKSVAAQFAPANWDANEIVDYAKSVGIQSIFLPAKSINGLVLFQSQHATLKPNNSIDLVKDLSTACENANIKFGIKYSLIDWQLKNGPDPTGHSADAISDSHMTINLEQIQDLMTNFGTIHHIHFENGSLTEEQSAAINEKVKSVQPECKVSGLYSIHNDVNFLRQPLFLENRFDMPWIFSSPLSDIPQKNAEELAQINLKKLLETTSSGGQFLASITLNNKGNIKKTDQNILQRISDWMVGKSDLIYNSTSTPFGIKSWGTISESQGNGKIYLSILDWPEDGNINLYGLDNHVLSVTTYGEDVQQIPYDKKGKNLIIKLDGKFEKELNASVLVVSYNGGIRVTPVKMAYAKTYSWELNRKNANISKTIQGLNDYAQAPVDHQYIWYLPPTQGGSYAMNIKFSRQELGNAYTLNIGDKKYDLILDKETTEERDEAADIIYGLYYLGTPSLKNELFTTRHGPTKGFPKSGKWGFKEEVSWKEMKEWNNGDVEDIIADPMSSTYVYQSMYSQADQVLLSTFIPDDGVTVWSNGNLIAEFLNIDNQDEVFLEIPINSGNNQMMYKFYNNRGNHKIGINHGVLAAQYIKSIGNPVELINNEITEVKLIRADGKNVGLGLVNFSININKVDQL